jgi:hypothetical protein
VSRTVQRLPYPEAAAKLAEADIRVARCTRELERAMAERDQALANTLHALWMKLNDEEPPR